MRLRATLTALVCCACFGLWLPSAARAAGDTSLEVSLGWGERLKAGRWVPITVRVSHPKVQTAILEVSAPQGGPDVMVVQQYFTLGPVATTLQVYAPMRYYGGENASVIIRNADSGKTLARFPPDPDGHRNFYEKFVNQSKDRLVGVSGARTALDAIRGEFNGVNLDLGYVPQYLLPRAAVGYDSLDLLLLNKAELLKLDADQQKAIVDWVRAGGNLLLWPGDDPVPTSGPLIDALPCRVEGPVTVQFDRAARLELGLPEHIAGVRGRKLVPNPKAGAEAEPLVLFPGAQEGEGYRRRLGLGRIVVSPINLGELQFDAPAKRQALWARALDGMGVLPGEGAADPTMESNRFYMLDPETSRQALATTRLMDFLGDVPGAGRFGFAYVAYVLLGMMVVVGPLDWFVLKKLGRQPWTWVTTAGWIGLITVGAIFAGRLIKSGTLHYRTVQLVDQVGGQTVGEVTLGCIYSPKTSEYQLLAPRSRPATQPAGADATAGATDAAPGTADPPAGWWLPASGEEGYSRHGLKNDMSFRQNESGNYPGPMLINVWNMRFTRGEVIAPGPAVIDAKLAVQVGGDGRTATVTGTVRNLGAEPLVNVRVLTEHGTFSPQAPAKEAADPLLSRLEPGAAAPVAGRVAIQQVQTPQQTQGNEAAIYRGRYGPHYERLAEGGLWRTVSDLSGQRSARIDRLLATGEYAVVYAEVPDPAPSASLRETGGVEKHYKVIRAVVPLGGPVPPP